MKKILLNIILLLFLSSSFYAQTTMSGMKYQAVARDLSGNIIADQDISLQISLSSDINAPELHYLEIHSVTTNQFGLFSLVIGEGQIKKGAFSRIPWSEEDIWMRIAIKTDGERDFAAISNSKLLAVPYAFHAGTANQVINGNTDRGPEDGVPSNVWSLFGNSNSDPTKDKIGTTDSTDLVFVTNNQERLRITADGQLITPDGTGLELGGSLTVHGDSVAIDKDLYVGRNVYLNTNDGFSPPGETINYGDFTVENMSATHLTGTLTVDKETDLNSALRVNNESPTDLTGTLNVNGVTDLNNDLNVDGITKLLNTTQSVTKDDGALVVEGGVGIEKNLNVGGDVSITGETSFGSPVTISDGTQSTMPDEGALIVVGGAGIGKNLNVGGISKVFNDATSTTADNGALVVTGGAGIGENLNVAGIAKVLNDATSTTADNGALVVTGGAGIGENLNVDGIAKVFNDATSTSSANGALVVTGGVGIGENLNVDGITKLWNDTESDTKDGGALVVEGGVGIEKNLNVGGNLNVSNDAEDYVTTFENTNGAGSGIRIRLGKTGTKNNPLAQAADLGVKGWLGELEDEDYEAIEDLLRGTVDVAWLAALAFPSSPEEAEELALALVSSACEIANFAIGTIVDGVNAQLSQVSIPETDILVGILSGLNTVADIFVDDDWIGATEDDDCTLCGVLVLPGLSIPTIPDLELPCSAIGPPSFFGLELSDVWVEDPLNGDNIFILFTDNLPDEEGEDFEMGAIKAQSIAEWSEDYIDIVYLYDLYTTFRAMDKAKVIPEMKLKAKEVAKAYLGIGVEYSSGNGDYAEWLERLDPNESISTGDIVGVKGGKITKDLTNAEQIMAISHRPIVLGNIPEKGKNHLGNNVAFMGQIPVKIMGPVETGDYIVGRTDIQGYGIAISPENMSIEDFKLAVGRSWNTNPDDGPKLVNTVVGVHNGDFLNIMKRYEQKFKESEVRMESVEAKIEMLTGMLSDSNKSE